MIVAGCTNKEMAAQLGITENTVKHHVTHVYEIIGVNSRYFARIRAKELGIG
jgi:DNA-binding CsgD family transcriptional regulator